MDFNLLITKNSKQAILKEFKPAGSSTCKIINLEETKSYSIQGFLYSEELKSEDFLSSIEGEMKFFPVRSDKDFELNPEKFEALNYDEAKIIFDKMRENWILQNNISLIEEIFKVRSHLLNLFPNDRSGFFEELWFLVKSTLGASNLKLIYNDMIKAKNENEKNKLVKVKVEGDRYPELHSCNEMDEMVLKHYEKEFGNIFEITDYNKEKGQLVICASIKKSPILIMANIYQLSRIQKALLVSLFEGINQ